MSDFPEMEYASGDAELELAPDEASLDFLQKVYRSSRQPLSVRMRAASIALPFEKPKLTAIATSSMDGASFAAMLDKAIARSQAPSKQIEHHHRRGHQLDRAAARQRKLNDDQPQREDQTKRE
jgi:hypothetical protein